MLSIDDAGNRNDTALGVLLCASSSTGTIHVWRCGRGSHEAKRNDANALLRRTGVSVLRNWVASTSGERDIASIRLKLPPSWCTCAIREDSLSHGISASVYVVTSRGEFFVFALDTETGVSSLRDERRLLSDERAQPNANLPHPGGTAGYSDAA